MKPGTWYARDDKIYITNPDGTEEVLSTNWEETRRARRAEEKQKELDAKKAIQEHQTEKREKQPKTRGGRGC